MAKENSLADNLRILGEMVKAKRQREGLSDEQVAEAVGCDKTLICRLELGRHASVGPDMDMLGGVCRWLGLPLAWIMTERDPKPTILKIRDVLVADKTLTPYTRTALYDLMKLAYSTVTVKVQL